MADVARHGDGQEPVSLTLVADRTAVSRGYLEQIATPLRHAGLLEGHAGRRGGYRLARPANSIHLDEIVEAAIGPICVVTCVAQPDLCERADDCECRILHGLVSLQISHSLHSHTLADLVSPAWLRRNRAAMKNHWPPAPRKPASKGDAPCR